MSKYAEEDIIGVEDYHDSVAFNDSGGNITGQAVDPDDEVGRRKIMVMSVIIALTIVGNGYILISIICKARQSSSNKMTRMYYFMLQLSVADIITAVFTMLPEVLWTLFGLPVLAPGKYRFYGGNFVCKGVKFGQMIGPYLSSYMLVMMTVDRFQAICYPLTNQVFAGRKSRGMVLAAWIFSLLLCIPQAHIFGASEGVDDCLADFIKPWGVKAYVTWYSMTNFFFPLCCLVFCYARICYAIWSLNKQKPPTPVTVTLNTSSRAATNSKAVDNTKKLSATRMVLSEANDDPMATAEDSQLLANSSAHSRQEFQLQPMSTPPVKAAEAPASGRTSDTADSSMTSSIASTSPQLQHPSILKNGNAKETNGNSAAAAAAAVKKSPPPRVLYRPPATSGLSRAVIRSIQQTVIIILMYIACSMPFTCAQLWSVWGTGGSVSGVAIMYYLVTLNSAVNPFIYIAFNRELRRPLLRLFPFLTRWKRSSSEDLAHHHRGGAPPPPPLNHRRETRFSTTMAASTTWA